MARTLKDDCLRTANITPGMARDAIDRLTAALREVREVTFVRSADDACLVADTEGAVHADDVELVCYEGGEQAVIICNHGPRPLMVLFGGQEQWDVFEVDEHGKTVVLNVC